MEPAKPVSGGSSGGSGSGGSGPSNLTIAEAKTVTGGTYQDVTITSEVGDGTVTLDGVSIQGSLTVQGGGSNSINLTGCTVSGKVVLSKEDGEAPRLHLTNTPISQVEANTPAIIEADDAASAITTVTAKANVEVKGSSTAISAITVPTAVSAPVAVTVTAGTVAKVEAKSETTVSGAAGSVTAVVAEAPVTVASEAVGKVEVPATAGIGVTVAVTGTTALEVEVNSTNGAAMTASGGATIDVSTTLDTPPANVTVGGTPVAHIHKWNVGVVTQEPTCAQDGVKTYTCMADGCTTQPATKTEETPRLPHTVVEDPAVAATCTTPGKTEGKHCSVCNAVITAQEAIPSLGHTEVVDPAVAATCTTPGKTEGKHCSVCNAVITAQETIAALGHTEVVDPAVAATCTTPGKTEGKHCSVCNAVITAQETIAALGHDFTGAYQTDASGHWHKCSRCDETDTKAAHTYNTTNCAEAATCTVCAYEKAAGTHTWGDWTKVDDTNHKHVCSSCKTEETAAHTWDAGVVTTPPTETTEGVMTHACTTCEATKTEIIPPVAGEDSKLTLTQNEDGTFSVTWDAVEGITDYALDIVNDSQADNPNHPFLSRTQPSLPRVDDLVWHLPLVAETTNDLTIIVYTCNSDYSIKDEIGRLTHVLDIAVAGEAVEYGIDFNTPEADSHKFTVTQGTSPRYVSGWYNNASQSIGYGFYSIPNNGSEITIKKAGLSDGQFFDLRALTSFTLSENKLNATITPVSKKTYTAPPVTGTTLTFVGNPFPGFKWTAVDGVGTCFLEIKEGDALINGSTCRMEFAYANNFAFGVTESKNALDVFLYKYDEITGKAGDLLASAPGALSVVVTSELLEYTMENSTTEPGKSTLTIVNPNGIYVYVLTDKDGKYKASGTGASPITLSKTFEEGDIMTVRTFSGTVVDNKLTITMSAPSQKTYTALP